MRGVLSEGMLMCASTPENVEVIDPPASCGKCCYYFTINIFLDRRTKCILPVSNQFSVPGDLVHCEGFVRNADAQLNPKKKIWETVAPDLKTNTDKIVCYKGQTLYVPDKGQLKSNSLAGVPVK